MLRQICATLLLLALTPVTFAKRNDEFKLESIGALTDAKVAEAVRATLNEKGWRISGKDGKAIAELWLRKEVPSHEGSIDGANFGQINEGALVGVITYPANTTDYRGQGLKAGTYILRYGVSMQDGAHLGVSPSRDFFLITRPDDDKDPKDLPAAEVLKLSRAAIGTGHPGPLALAFPTSDPKDLPKVVSNEHEQVILEFKLKLKSGELPIGFIVVGKSSE
jgi:hypothetical protein